MTRFIKRLRYNLILLTPILVSITSPVDASDAESWSASMGATATVVRPLEIYQQQDEKGDTTLQLRNLGDANVSTSVHMDIITVTVEY